MFDWHPALKRRATITADNATRLTVAFTVDLTYGTLIQVMVPMYMYLPYLYRDHTEYVFGNVWGGCYQTVQPLSHGGHGRVL